MSEVLLYSFRRCPYAMRARLALRYSGVPVRIVEVSLKAKPAEMLALSPKGTVPVLSVDGEVIDESLAIMQWALAQHDPDNWLLGVTRRYWRWWPKTTKASSITWIDTSTPSATRNSQWTIIGPRVKCSCRSWRGY